MRIKLDENIPARLTSILGRVGHEVDTVKSEGLAGRDDVTIWEKLKEPAAFLLRRT
jgi:predicted nuclease of predicted toxin-antitoxin system